MARECGHIGAARPRAQLPAGLRRHGAISLDPPKTIRVSVARNRNDHAPAGARPIPPPPPPGRSAPRPETAHGRRCRTMSAKSRRWVPRSSTKWGSRAIRGRRLTWSETRSRRARDERRDGRSGSSGGQDGILLRRRPHQADMRAGKACQALLTAATAAGSARDRGPPPGSTEARAERERRARWAAASRTPGRGAGERQRMPARQGLEQPEQRRRMQDHAQAPRRDQRHIRANWIMSPMPCSATSRIVSPARCCRRQLFGRSRRGARTPPPQALDRAPALLVERPEAQQGEAKRDASAGVPGTRAHSALSTPSASSKRPSALNRWASASAASSGAGGRDPVPPARRGP